jgi:NAD(P)-dependent dehydrogenase (short-subunit alcohol dehydrogenase family)
LEIAQKTANALASEGVCALALKVDVTNPEEAEQMADEVVRKFGRIDVLFNNAGTAQWVNAEEMSLEEIGNVLGLDVGTVKAHMFRAVGKLREDLRDLYGSRMR